METSYFSKYKGNNGVNIAMKPPNFFTGESYPDLYPKWSFLSKYFKDKNEVDYIFEYYNQVLSKLDPKKVWKDLDNCTLLCYEKSHEFCHRRLVAEWLQRNLGVVVLETK